MTRPARTSALAAMLLCACAPGGELDRPASPTPDAPVGAPATPTESEAPADPRMPRVAVAVALEDAVLGEFAERVLEGVRLAVEEAGARVDLAVQEQGGAAGVAAAEAAGALVVIGPLDDAAFQASAAAREDASLALLSPTATRAPAAANAYALNGEDTRGAEALAAWAAERGLRTVGMLYPGVPTFASQAEAFQRAAEGSGIRVVQQPYTPGTTTFAEPLRALRATGIQALFIPASERDVRQIAPQIRYYGMGSIQLLGNDAWVSPAVLGGLDAALLEGLVAATPLSAEDEAAWDAFTRRYEARFRRSLDSPVPALGHDAALLVLAALRGGGDRAAVARRLGSVQDLRGATGVLSVREGRITRQPHLVTVRGGRTVPVGR